MSSPNGATAGHPDPGNGRVPSAWGLLGALSAAVGVVTAIVSVYPRTEPWLVALRSALDMLVLLAFAWLLALSVNAVGSLFRRRARSQAGERATPAERPAALSLRARRFWSRSSGLAGSAMVVVLFGWLLTGSGTQAALVVAVGAASAIAAVAAFIGLARWPFTKKFRAAWGSSAAVLAGLGGGTAALLLPEHPWLGPVYQVVRPFQPALLRAGNQVPPYCFTDRAPSKVALSNLVRGEEGEQLQKQAAESWPVRQKFVALWALSLALESQSKPQAIEVLRQTIPKNVAAIEASERADLQRALAKAPRHDAVPTFPDEVRRDAAEEVLRAMANLSIGRARWFEAKNQLAIELAERWPSDETVFFFGLGAVNLDAAKGSFGAKAQLREMRERAPAMLRKLRRGNTTVVGGTEFDSVLEAYHSILSVDAFMEDRAALRQTIYAMLEEFPDTPRAHALAGRYFAGALNDRIIASQHLNIALEGDDPQAATDALNLFSILGDEEMVISGLLTLPQRFPKSTAVLDACSFHFFMRSGMYFFEVFPLADPITGERRRVLSDNHLSRAKELAERSLALTRGPSALVLRARVAVEEGDLARGADLLSEAAGAYAPGSEPERWWQTKMWLLRELDTVDSRTEHRMHAQGVVERFGGKEAWPWAELAWAMRGIGDKAGEAKALETWLLRLDRANTYDNHYADAWRRAVVDRLRELGHVGSR